MSQAQWTTTQREVTYATDPDGSFRLSLPLLDDGVKQGTLSFSMTAARGLEVVWTQEPDAEGLSDFRAWSKES